MRIVAGSARGRTFDAPPGKGTRPTLDRVRESVFNIIQFDVPAARVLDLFAGSGGMGLEALSRGAALSVFNDASAACAEMIQTTLDRFAFTARARVLCRDYGAAVRALAGCAFDLIFLDPPYGQGMELLAIQAILSEGLLAREGKILLEHPKAFPFRFDGLTVASRRTFGTSALSILMF